MRSIKYFFFFLAFIATASMFAQNIQNARPNNQTGLNVFEPAKDVNSTFDGVFVKVGGNFTQQFQALSHENTSGVALYALAPGFNLATANLNLNVQLEDGISLTLENYMSSRHHTEFWVKGGYIQIDKLPMFNNSSWFDDNFRVKIGHFQPNYGDQQFRRTDNGNAIFNPFIGNYIMDAFATEIGTEVYAFLNENVVVMAGMTTGLIKGDISEYTNGKQRQPSIYLKAAYDDQLSDDLRVRLSASMVNNANSGRNTLYGGDRTGSRFYGALEAEGADLASKAFSGRWNPGFTNKLMAIQFNPFVKFKGLEVFGIYEIATGNTLTGSSDLGYSFDDKLERTVSQIGGELVYRFAKNEQFYVGAKYNQVSGQLKSSWTDANGDFTDASIDRIEIGAGWFPTKNLLLKGAYINQNYNDAPTGDILEGGNFNGIMIEAAVGF